MHVQGKVSSNEEVIDLTFLDSRNSIPTATCLAIPMSSPEIVKMSPTAVLRLARNQESRLPLAQYSTITHSLPVQCITYGGGVV